MREIHIKELIQITLNTSEKEKKYYNIFDACTNKDKVLATQFPSSKKFAFPTHRRVSRISSEDNMVPI